MHAAILSFIKNLRERNEINRLLLYFLTFLQCEECGCMIGGDKVRVGNEYLLTNLNHFLSLLPLTHRVISQ